jgi:hypothetical protein
MADYQKLPVATQASLKPEITAEDSYWNSFVEVLVLIYTMAARFSLYDSWAS